VAYLIPLVASDSGENVIVAVIRDAPLVKEVEARGIHLKSGDRDEVVGTAASKKV